MTSLDLYNMSTVSLFFNTWDTSSDFADSFDLNNDPNVGTHTTLVSGTEYPCDLHVDGVTNITATCYTRYDISSKHNDLHMDGITKPLPLVEQ